MFLALFSIYTTCRKEGEKESRGGYISPKTFSSSQRSFGERELKPFKKRGDLI
jgi:hypothetical protein